MKATFRLLRDVSTCKYRNSSNTSRSKIVTTFELYRQLILVKKCNVVDPTLQLEALSVILN